MGDFEDNIEGFMEFLGNLTDKLKTRRITKKYLREVYERLVQGEVYDWNPQALIHMIEVLKYHGLKKEVEILSYGPRGKMDPVQDYNTLSLNMPDYFKERVERGAILGEDEQKGLKEADKETVFDRLFNHVTAFGIDILPIYASPAMRELEAELLQTMQSYRDIVDDWRGLRKELGKKADIIELEQIGEEMYTKKRRPMGSEQGTGQIEFKVAEAAGVEGPRFIARKVYGYYGILRYYLEEVAKVAPESANAVLDGTGILRNVKFRGMWSPIVAGTVLRPIDQPDGEYHVLPLKFFKVKIDKSRKYKTDMEVVAWDDDNKPYAWREVARPIDGKDGGSKSDKCLVVSR